MDDPFHVRGTGPDQTLYSNSSVREHMVGRCQLCYSITVRYMFSSRCFIGFDLRYWGKDRLEVLAPSGEDGAILALIGTGCPPRTEQPGSQSSHLICFFSFAALMVQFAAAQHRPKTQ